MSKKKKHWGWGDSPDLSTQAQDANPLGQNGGRGHQIIPIDRRQVAKGSSPKKLSTPPEIQNALVSVPQKGSPVAGAAGAAGAPDSKGSSYDPHYDDDYAWGADGYSTSGYKVGNVGFGYGGGAAGDKTRPSITVVITPCHAAPFEAYPGVFVGKIADFKKAVEAGAEVLIPLASVFEEVWGYFDGDIYAIPIADYGTLKADLLKKKAEQVAGWVRDGRKVAIGCMGGHGRTGYFAAAVLGLLGVPDPVGELREKYCKKAVESGAQLKSLEDLFPGAEWIGKHTATKTFAPTSYGSPGGYGSGAGANGTYGAPRGAYEQNYRSLSGVRPITAMPENNIGRSHTRWDTCYECEFYQLQGACAKHNIKRDKGDTPCLQFSPFSRTTPVLKVGECAGCGGELGIVPGVILEQCPDFDGDVPVHTFTPCPVCKKITTLDEAAGAITRDWGGLILAPEEYFAEVLPEQGQWADLDNPDVEAAIQLDLAAMEEEEEEDGGTPPPPAGVKAVEQPLPIGSTESGPAPQDPEPQPAAPREDA